MTAEGLLFLFISIAVMVIKPGPGMVAIVMRALQDGFIPAMALSLGLASMHLIYFPMAAISFSLEGALVNKITFILQLLGAFYILWIGIKGLRNLSGNPWDKRNAAKPNRVLWESYTSGIAINLSNPYVVLFYVGLMPTIFDFNSFGVTDIVIGTAVTFTIVLSLLSLECALASQMREFLRDYNIVRVVNLVSSIAMIGIGLFVLIGAMGLWNLSLT